MKMKSFNDRTRLCEKSKFRGLGIVAITLLAFSSISSIASARSKLPDTEPDYTKGEELPIRIWLISDSVNLGPIGAMAQCWARQSGHNPTDTSRMLDVYEIYEDSPAEGKLEPGDVIVGVVAPKIPPLRAYDWVPASEKPASKDDYLDATLFPYDVREALAAAITEAEKEENGGNLVLNVWRNGQTRPVALELPVMGSYSRTSPFDCEKSERLITRTADQILEQGMSETGVESSLEALGLLATGEPEYIDFVREWVHSNPRFDPSVTEVWRRGDTARNWDLSYELIFLAEYYMATGDAYVKPTLNRYTEILVIGQSHAGTWTHLMADPEFSYGRDHGMTASYGSMNVVTGTCSVALVLARKAGAEHERLDTAIQKSLDFLAYFAERGTVPYGDHKPWMGSNDSNGKNSQCAVLFDLAGKPKEAKYFSKMTLASHRFREQGHTGHYWSFIWGHIAAARAGDEAAQAFVQNMNWFHELERRPDHSYVVQPQLRHGHWKTEYWSTAGVRLLGLCLPRKEIHLTGKGGNSFAAVTGDELVDVVEAGTEWPNENDSLEALFADLASFSPVVREYAARALGQKEEDLVDELIALLRYAKDENLRRGAATALAYAGRGSEEAVDTLIEKLKSSEDQVLKHFVVRAFKGPRDGNGIATSDAIAKAVPVLLKQATVEDPADPWRKLHSMIAETLFNRSALVYDRPTDQVRYLDDVDRDLLIAAIQSFLSNVNGFARSWTSQIFKHLDDETLEPLWRDIFIASLLPAPSGVMHHQLVMTNGVELMAEKGFKEGAMVGAIQIRRPGWGERRRVPTLAGILPEFGSYTAPFREDMVPYLESLIQMVRDGAEARGGGLLPGEERRIEHLKGLIAQIEMPLPKKDLRSIEPYLQPGDLELAEILLNYYPTKLKPWNL